MKQMKVTEKRIGENVFYIRPFPAFTSANISGELAAMLTPILGGILPIFGGAFNGSSGIKDINIMDIEIESAGPALAEAFSKVSGDKFEQMMMKLLINSKNISVSGEATNGETQLLTLDLANEIFCMDIQDMYFLCFEVIKINFGGFFKKLGIQSGNLLQMVQEKMPSMKNGVSSTQADSAN